LLGDVQEEPFARLAEGQHPLTGEQLVRHQGDVVRYTRGSKVLGIKPGEYRTSISFMLHDAGDADSCSRLNRL